MFTLEIELGNAAMCEAEHVAEALEQIAQRVRGGEDDGRVRDLNGNTVGTWSVNYPDPEPDV